MICPVFASDSDEVAIGLGKKTQRSSLLQLLQRHVVDVGQVSSYHLLPGPVTAFIYRFYKAGLEGSKAMCAALLHEQCVLELLPRSAFGFCDAVCSQMHIDAVKQLELHLIERGCATLSKPLLACWQADRDITMQLLQYLSQRVKEVVQLLMQQKPDPVSHNLPHKYNPTVNLEAYYFGDRVREMPRYPFADNTPADQPAAVEACEKKRAHNSKESHFFFVCCPEHGHCHGASSLVVLTFYRVSCV